MLFKPKRPVDEDEWEWLLAGFKWLERQYPELAESRRLALPTRDFFPPISARGVQLGEQLMAQVKAIGGIGDWPVTLIPVKPPPRGAVNNVAALQHGKGAAGTFRLVQTDKEGPIAEIRYSVDQLENPAGLVATFAHEISHYLLHMYRTPFLGGDDVEELFTDLTAVWLGFGIFLGNSARYGHHIDEGAGRGWFVSGWRGYLSERMLMTALALSEMSAGRYPDAASPYLKSYLTSDVRMAQKYAARRDLRAEIEEIDLADYGA